jgi:hypothetical protein
MFLNKKTYQIILAVAVLILIASPFAYKAIAATGLTVGSSSLSGTDDIIYGHGGASTGNLLNLLNNSGASFVVDSSGNLNLSGTITSDGFSGSLAADDIAEGNFGANTGGGNYSFPGNVSIGTTSSSHKLTVMGSGYFLGDTSVPNAPTDLGFYLGKSLSDENRRMEVVSPTGGVSYIDFTEPSVDYRGRLAYYLSDNSFRLYTNGSEKMRINSSGSVGIGVSDPQAKLVVDGGLAVNQNSNLIYTAHSHIAQPSMSTTFNNENIYDKADYDALSVGLRDGTNHISSLKFLTYDGGTRGARIIYATNGATGINSGLHFYEGSASMNHAMSMDGGKVGIGSTDPQATLDVAGEIIVGSYGGDNQAVPRSYIDTNFAPITGGAGSAFVQGGNSFGTTATLGTNDAQSLAFETVGATRMTIDTSGNVGIGTTSSNQKLTVWGDSANNVGINIYNNTFGTNQGNFYLFKTGASYAVTDQRSAAVFESYGDMIFSSAKATDITAPSIKFQTGRSGTFGNTRMMIDSIGNVGIGTTNPLSRLDVSSAVYGFPATSGTSQPAGALRLSSAGGNVILDTGLNTSSGAWLQVTNKTTFAATYPLLLNPNGGDIGIGTTSAAAKLDVAGQIKVGSYGADANAVPKSYVDGVASKWTLSGTNIYNNNTSGNVGIGTTSPADKLDVYGSIGIDGQRSMLGTTDILYMGDIDSGDSRRELQLRAGGLDSIRIDNDGNVGIGSTAPQATLDVNGQIRVGSYGGDANAVPKSYVDTATELPDTAKYYLKTDDYESFINIDDNMTTAEVKEALGMDDASGLTKVDDPTAPAPGAFEVSGYRSVGPDSSTPYWKVDQNSEYIFETWIKVVSSTTATQRFYAGWEMYNSSKSSFGNTQRYWASIGTEYDSNSYNDGQWHHIVARISGVGSAYGQFIDGTEYARLVLLMNYSSGDTVTRYAGMKLYKSAKTFTSIYATNGQKTVDSSNLVMDYSGNLFPNNITASGGADIAGQIKVGSYGGDDNAVPKSYIDTNFAPITGGVGSAFVQGGNSFGATAILGTNDTQSLALETVGATRMTIDTSGNVGIGTATIGSELDVYGDLSASMYYDRDNTNYYIDPAANVMSHSAVFAGNVGIGTTSPSKKLDVVGNINIDGSSAYLYDGVQALRLSKNGETNYYSTIVGLDAGNAGSLNSQRQTALGYYAGNLNSGNSQLALGYYAGYQNTGYDQNVLGRFAGYQNTGSDQIALGYQAGYQNTGSDQLALGYYAGYQNTGYDQNVLGRFAGYQNIGGDQIALGYQAGYQNTGSDQIALGYYAGHQSTGDSVIFLGRFAGYLNSGDNVVGLGWQAGYNNTANNQFIVRHANVNSTPLIQGNFATGFVGIGTSSPNTKLDVNGAIRVGSYGGSDQAVPRSYIDTNFAPIGGGAYWEIGGNSLSDKGYLGATSNHSIGIKTNDIERLTILNDGNVGIGTAGPTSKLDVLGTVSASNLYSSGILNVTNSASIGTSLDVGGGAATDGVFVNGRLEVSGNVGIGTSNPSALLHLSKVQQTQIVIDTVDSSYRDIIFNQGSTNVGRIRYFDAAYSHTNDALRFSVGTNLDIFNIIGSGYVGIGTTAPGVPLDVQNSGITTYSIYAGSKRIGNVAEPVNDSDAATRSYVDSVLSSPEITGDLNMNNHDINNVKKLTVNTIDPLYEINNVLYSSYAASVVGGVKEEYIAKTKINQYNSSKGEYERVIDFNNQKEGSELWLWYKTVDFNEDNVDIFVTPYGDMANVYYEIKDKSIIFRSDKSVSVSYRLIGRRFDWKSWPTIAEDQSQQAGLKID